MNNGETGMRLERKDAVLVVVDVQGNLAMAMHGRDTLFEQLRLLIEGANVLGIPVLALEQCPEKLGATISEISEILPPKPPIPKTSFSCCGADDFLSFLKRTGRNQVLLAGIETHVCIIQTALDLLSLGYDVQVPADAVSSRTAENKQIALDRLREAGGVVTSVEMALMEMLRDASDPVFKDLLRLVK